MDSQADPTPPGPGQSLVEETHRVRRPLGGLFWLVSLVALAALVVGTTFISHSRVEDALRSSASKHLDAVGMKGVALEVDGVNVTAKVPFGRDVHDVEAQVATVAGVGFVTSQQVYRSKAERKACTNLQRDLDRATDKRRIPFVGVTARPTPAGIAMLKRSAALLKACPGATIIVGGHSDPHTNNFSTLSLERARVMVAALKKDGIPAARLTPRGYGDEFAKPGDGPAARQRNERGSLTVQGG